MKQNNLLIRTKEVLRKKDIGRAIKDALRIFYQYLYFKIFMRNKRFKFDNKVMKYFYYPYNATWRNERAVEIPIAWSFVKQNRGKRILELGNVLSHYFSVDHEILDKYEKAKGVINADIVDFKPAHKYDLIAAISTIEHIGWDEVPKEPVKVLKAIKNLKKILNKKGKIVLTVPLGYNSYLDSLIKEMKIFDEQIFLKRISKSNIWKEIKIEEAKNIEYGKPFPFANGIAVGIING